MTSEFAEPLQQIDRTSVLWRGRKLTYFAGCDYLRLSSHPAVLKAARDCLDRFGLNVAASRKTTGNHRIYSQLETAIRRFFHSESSVISSTGYFTNVIAAQGLRGAVDLVFIDQRAHGSLRDAALVLGCRVIEFNHRDPSDLERKLSQATPRTRVALMTDGMFSQDGSIAPLGEYRAVLGPRALLWVDDAHAGGIIGPQGRGTAQLWRLEKGNFLQTVTFSKAFGTYGGAILCESRIATMISDKSAAVGGNTPTPLPLAYATIASLQLCNSEVRKKLFDNIKLFWQRLGSPEPEFLSPIVSFAPKNPVVLRRKLLAASIYPPYIHYPGGPVQGYFRFALSAEHSAPQISTLAKVLVPCLASALCEN